MEGVVEGGWGYVVAAYGIVWGGLLLYGVSLFWRERYSRQLEKELPPSK